MSVVDVGGPHGLAAMELARNFPTLRLKDLDEPILTDADIQKPDDIVDRIPFMVHDSNSPAGWCSCVLLPQHFPQLA